MLISPKQDLLAATKNWDLFTLADLSHFRCFLFFFPLHKARSVISELWEKKTPKTSS